MSAEKESRDAARFTSSGLPIAPVYTREHVEDIDPDGDIGSPGEFPFTRGVYPRMYRGRLWTMRQYAGFGTAEESNARYRLLLARGVTGLSVAFDLPTQLGLDSDDPRAAGEVGRSGVAIDSLEDMERLFDGIALDRVSTSMTINATAAILLSLYIAVGRRQGVSLSALSGTVQNDILKEYVARGTYIYPPAPSMRLATDIIEYCARELPNWNSISISGYHIREAGATAVQEVAFTLAHGLAYVDAARGRGLAVNDFGPRLSFFFNAHNNFFEEIAKFRAARRLWARLLRERYNASDAACKLRFHTQTGGSTLTAQQPDNNVVRVTLQALAAVLGGTQSLHTNASDEALALPSETAATVALRTQQIIAYESGVPDTADPLAGSYYVEALTREIEAAARDYIARIEERGGVLRSIETGYEQREVQEAAYAAQRRFESGESVVVGVNRFAEDAAVPEPEFRLPAGLEERRRSALDRLRKERNAAGVNEALASLAVRARGTDNLMPAIIHAVEAYATVGEIAGTLRQVFGLHQEVVT
jgi:methylmalonyl-CoA mutase N-terminal domain/subunit